MVLFSTNEPFLPSSDSTGGPHSPMCKFLVRLCSSTIRWKGFKFVTNSIRTNWCRLQSQVNKIDYNTNVNNNVRHSKTVFSQTKCNFQQLLLTSSRCLSLSWDIIVRQTVTSIWNNSKTIVMNVFEYCLVYVSHVFKDLWGKNVNQFENERDNRLKKWSKRIDGTVIEFWGISNLAWWVRREPVFAGILKSYEKRRSEAQFHGNFQSSASHT